MIKNNIIASIVFHRHGARYPMRDIGDRHWPRCKEFWETNSANLTPQGYRQCFELGLKLKDRYFNILQNPRILCFTNNKNRTIQSLNSLLDALIESYSISFDQTTINNDTVNIIVNSDIFEYKKNDKKMKSWQINNLDDCVFIDQHYLELKQQLTIVTKQLLINSDDILFVKSINTQVLISACQYVVIR